MSDLTLIDASDTPVDPHADEYDDTIEGTLHDGTPVVSVNGSEDDA